MRRSLIDKELDAIEVEVKQSRKRKPKTADLPKIILDTNITPQQEAYCRGISLGMSHKEAADLANIDPKEARDWAQSPPIRSRITELTEIVTQNSILKNGLDRGWIISRLMTVTERCMQAEPVKDKDGNPTGEFRFDSAGANRALELLGKTLRMFDGRDQTKQDEYAHLSDDEINRIALELASQTGLLLTDGT